MSTQIAHYPQMTPVGGASPQLGIAPLPPPVIPATDPMPLPAAQLSNAYYQPAFTPPASILPAGPVQVAGVPLAQSLPLGPLPVLPTPEEVAPDVFKPKQPYGWGYIPPSSNGVYNYSPSNYYNWATPPMPPQGPNPATQPLPPALETKPPVEAEPPAAEKEPVKKNDSDTSLPKPELALTPALIKQLNQDFEDSDYNVRQQASRQLAKIIESDPDILTKPEYGDYPQALILKNLKDPNALARQPLLLAMEAGQLNGATPRIIAQLKEVKKKNGLYGFEPNSIDRIMTVIQEKEAIAASKAADKTTSNPPPATAGKAESGKKKGQPVKAVAPLAAQDLGTPPEGDPTAELPPELAQLLKNLPKGQAQQPPLPASAPAMWGPQQPPVSRPVTTPPQMIQPGAYGWPMPANRPPISSGPMPPPPAGQRLNLLSQ